MNLDVVAEVTSQFNERLEASWRPALDNKTIWSASFALDRGFIEVDVLNFSSSGITCHFHLCTAFHRRARGRGSVFLG